MSEIPFNNHIPIEVPYNLKYDEIQIDPAAQDSSLDEEMAWFVDNVSWGDEETCERIMRGAVILHHKFPDRSFGECFGTAIIWEVG